MYKILTKKTKRSRHHEKIVAQFVSPEEVGRYLQTTGIKATGTPYFFTHIDLSNGDIITQEIHGFTCSPETLAKSLGLR